MKRMLSAILVLCLLTAVLAGCPLQKDPGVGDVLVPWGNQEPSQGSETPSQGEPESIPNDGSAFMLERLPEIGDFVSDEKIDCFFPDGPAKTFTPRSDYGRLVPYLGGAIFAETQKYYEYTNPETGETERYENFDYSSRYTAMTGLATEDGKIVTAPIFGSLQRVTDCGNGIGWYTFSKGGDEWFEGEGPCTIVALDGSWSVTREGYGRTISLVPFGLNRFLCADADTGTCYAYDAATGQKVGDFSVVMRGKDPSYYNYPDGVLYADEAGVLFHGRLMYGAAQYFETYTGEDYYYTMLDWNGQELDSFLSDAYLNRVAGRVFRSDFYDEIFLHDEHGGPIAQESFLDVFYCEAEDLILCPMGSSQYFRMYYLTPQGEFVEPPENAWTWNAWSFLNDSFGKGWNGVLFEGTDGGRSCRNFWGEKVALPVPDNEIDALQHLYYTTQDGALFIHTTGDRDYICEKNGALLAEVRKPKVSHEFSYDSYAITAGETGAAVLTAEGELYYYDFAAGTEILLQTESISQFRRYKNAPEMWIMAAGGGSAVIGFSFYDNNDYTQLTVQFSTGDGAVLNRNVRVATATDGWLSVADDAGSRLYRPDGSVAYRGRSGAWS